MPRIDGLTDAQSEFLRAFRMSSFGPNVAFWPTVAVLRRWLRRPAFVRAMRSIAATLRWHGDFQLLAGAAAASHSLQTFAADHDFQLLPAERETMCQMIRMMHLRERRGGGADDSLSKLQTPDEALLEQLRRVDPKLTVEEFLKAVEDGVEEESVDDTMKTAA